MASLAPALTDAWRLRDYWLRAFVRGSQQHAQHYGAGSHPGEQVPLAIWMGVQRSGAIG